MCKKLSILVFPVWLCGCASQINNVFVDPGVGARAELTTASAEGFRSGRPALQDHRGWRSSTLEYHHTEVTHWPIWWEDPFADKGNDATDPHNRDAADREFAVTWVDCLAVPYGYARCFVNTVGWPVSAIVTPPGTVMACDGRISKGLLGYDHDAQRTAMNTESVDRIRRDDKSSAAPATSESAAPSSAATKNLSG